MKIYGLQIELNEDEVLLRQDDHVIHLSLDQLQLVADSLLKLGRPTDKTLDRSERALDLQMSDMEASMRSRRAMKKLNIDTVRDLCAHSAEELQSVGGGPVADELRTILVHLGLDLRDA